MTYQDLPTQVGNTVGDGSGTPTNLLTDADGHLQIEMTGVDVVVGNTKADGTGTNTALLTNAGGNLLPLIGNTKVDGTGTSTALLTSTVGTPMLGNTKVDGTGTAEAIVIKAASTAALATDAAVVTRPMMPTNGTQTMPTGDALARALIVVPSNNGYPTGATPLTACAIGTTGALAATLAKEALKTVYCTGFEVTGLGATGAALLTVTLVGVLGGTLTYYVAVPAGATLQMTPLVVEFPVPIPASDVNTDIVLNVSAPGTGCPAMSAVAHGYKV